MDAVGLQFSLKTKTGKRISGFRPEPSDCIWPSLAACGICLPLEPTPPGHSCSSGCSDCIMESYCDPS
ncbi:hypothetical protein FQV39_07980 [Bosea sp. F3-2]|nr:hypothetical protein FQV39_07980 [Bosea sp. F3-2]